MTEIPLKFKYTEKEYKEIIRKYYVRIFRIKIDPIISVLVCITGIICWVYLGYSSIYIGFICDCILIMIILHIKIKSHIIWTLKKPMGGK
jgi:hypothetical protein